jgi:plastocyanin
MIDHMHGRQFLFIFLCLLCGGASADRFLVTDQNGEPVKGAVIELTGLDPSVVSINRKQTAVMDQVNKRFVPQLLVIKANDEVSFPNSDNIRHHVYSFSPAKPFELKLYSGQPKAPLLFEKPGIVVLGCNIHDSMVGYVYVAESGFVETTDEKGGASVSLNYKGIRVWHPNQSSGPMNVMSLGRESLKALSEDDKVFAIALSLEPPEPRNTFQHVFKHDQ